MLDPGPHPIILREDTEAKRLYLPDGRYFLRSLRRQAVLILFTIALLTPLALMMGYFQKDRMSSYVAAIYDDRDSPEAVPRYPMYPRFAQVADSFKTKLADPEFLWQIAIEVGLNEKDKKGLSPFKMWIRRHVPGASLLIPPLDSEKTAQDDAKAKDANAQYLIRAMNAQFDDKKNIISLRIDTTDALLSKQLADAAMELFIQNELRFEAESFRRQHEVFAGYLHTLTLSAEAEHKAETNKKKEEKGLAQGKSIQERLREQENDLLDKIQSLRTEGDQEKSRSAAQRASLEADLARLTTRLEPSHPDVIAKQEEVRQLSHGTSDQGQRLKISQLKSQLAGIRDQERTLGMTVTAAEGRGEDYGPQRGQFLPALSDRVKELSLEEIRMERQAEAPALRTRLRLVGPASFDATPPGKGRREATMMFLALALAGALLAALLRELRTPYARDLWRVAWRSQLPVLSHLDVAGLKSYQSITPQLASKLRDTATSSNLRQSLRAGEVLQAYRRFEFELRQRCSGQVVLLQSAAEHGSTADFCYNFLNVICSETPGPVLLIDCDSRDPIPSGGNLKGPRRSLADFLSGHATWREVRQNRSAERAFDLVAAPSPEAAQMAFTRSAVQNLLTSLAKPYSRIYIRAYDIRRMLETEPFLESASDCVLLVDARCATFAEVERAARLTPKAKTLGLVMIGT